MIFYRAFSKVKDYIVNLLINVKYPQLKKTFLCESHLTRAERVKLFCLSKDKKNIAEIGSYIGASACCFGAALVSEDGKEEARLLCIDTWQNDAMSEGGRDTWDEFKKNTSAFEKVIVPIRGFSTDVIDQVANEVSSLDLLFIDGDHSYEGVKADWDSYKDLLIKGSTVVFHDIGWAEGVQRVVREDVEPLVQESGRLPNMWWGVLAKKP